MRRRRRIEATRMEMMIMIVTAGSTKTSVVKHVRSVT